MKKIGGTAFRVSVAAGIVVCIWIHNVAFSIPIFMWTDVRFDYSGRINCHPRYNPTYVFVVRIINFYLPLVITWASYIGISYKNKILMNKAIL